MQDFGSGSSIDYTAYALMAADMAQAQSIINQTSLENSLAEHERQIFTQNILPDTNYNPPARIWQETRSPFWTSSFFW